MCSVQAKRECKHARRVHLLGNYEGRDSRWRACQRSHSGNGDWGSNALRCKVPFQPLKHGRQPQRGQHEEEVPRAHLTEHPILPQNDQELLCMKPEAGHDGCGDGVEAHCPLECDTNGREISRAPSLTALSMKQAVLQQQSIITTHALC